MPISWARSSSCECSRLCTALCSEVSGFFNSCATSAAKRSMTFMRAKSRSVISRRAPDNSAISSRRCDKSGIVSKPGRLGEVLPKPRMAAAKRRTGTTIVAANKSEVMILTASAMAESCKIKRRSSANSASISPGRVDTISAPTMAR